ncbi:DNA-processing protein DprA [Luteimonas huabeiensis]|uniref:DNA-processing protein DprA n=1 Tax=Luteimonas huabeiensis TaxID=1244513 RepID=UPI000464E8B5|nr:DNA-processing protein DprA [Luteimonas huabeiensis]
MPAPHPDADTDCLLRLAAAGGALAPRRALLAAHASPAAALAAGPEAWAAAGLDAAQRRALRAPPPDLAAGWSSARGHRVLGWRDPDYPPLLRDAPNPPPVLFVAGDVDLLWSPLVAVVGSRRPTAGGLDHARAFSRALAAAGLGIASGLALGVDAAAHEAALDAGAATVAVLGCGPDLAYPRANARLHARIEAAGAVVSEHPPGTPALREHFPARNRIVAGLSLGVLVIEAAYRSGALITARLAAEAGREAFAVPGSIHNPMARGCHRLIRDGAQLVERAEEVAAALAPVAQALGGALRRRLGAPIYAPGAPPGAPGTEPVSADPDYNRLWQALGHDPTGMDRLVERTGLTTAEVSSMLLLMELDGRVVVEHGRYSRTSATRRPQGAGRGQ